jgi:metal-responsive CopG/Arc/MetJ family transcriptional regulator
MKTAISIPDPIFEAAEQLARKSGVSRSKLYTTAIAAYVEKHRAAHITEQLNQLYATDDSSLDEVIQRLQTLSLSKEEW